MFRKLLCVLFIFSLLLVGTAAVAGTPMPIPPSSGINALGPQPEPPDLPAGFFDWFFGLLQSLFR